MSETAEHKITRAKASLITKSPFFAIIAMRMEFIEAPWCRTMATDGINFYWCREWVDKLTKEEICGVICHEVLHVAWLHITRILGRDHKVWNYATDIAINIAVRELGFKLPKEGWHGPEFEKYKDWSADAIYADLLKNPPKGGLPGYDDKDGSGDGTTWGGIVKVTKEDGTPLTKQELAELESEIKIAVTEAAEAAKQRGKLPGALQGLVKAVGTPVIDWKSYVQQWVKGHTPDNYTWARPNRSMLVNHHVYMPRMQLHGAGHGVLSVDASGSVSDEELRKYVREIAGLIEMCSPDKLTIMVHDAKVHYIREWEHGDEFNDLKIVGRGGTNIQPSFKAALGLEDEVDWMICFTDMGIGDYPPAPGPHFPVLWCATGPDNAPFGTYLPLKDPMA